MKLWLVRTILPLNYGDYDIACIVRAETEPQARALAAERGYEDERDAWLDPEATSCQPIDAVGAAAVLLRSHFEG